MNDPTWEDQQRIAKKADAIVDSAWHYSWHWKRDDTGYLTLEGWRQVLADAESLAAERENHAKRLRELIAEVQPVIAKYERWAAEDAEDSAPAAPSGQHVGGGET